MNTTINEEDNGKEKIRAASNLSPDDLQALLVTASQMSEFGKEIETLLQMFNDVKNVLLEPPMSLQTFTWYFVALSGFCFNWWIIKELRRANRTLREIAKQQQEPLEVVLPQKRSTP